MHRFVIKLKKTHFGSLFDQKPQCKIFPQKNPLESILHLHVAVTSYKKLEEFHGLIFHKI